VDTDNGIMTITAKVAGSPLSITDSSGNPVQVN
jgi:hypothetical protein